MGDLRTPRSLSSLLPALPGLSQLFRPSVLGAAFHHSLALLGPFLCDLRDLRECPRIASGNVSEHLAVY